MSNGNMKRSVVKFKAEKNGFSRGFALIFKYNLFKLKLFEIHNSTFRGSV